MICVAKAFVLCLESQKMYYKVGGIIGRSTNGGLPQIPRIRIMIYHRKSMVLIGV